MKSKSVSFLLLCLLILLSCNNQKEARQAEGFIKAGNFQVYYQQNGDGDPLVLVHAGLQNSSMWDEQVKEFSKKYKVITFDLPFHGKTIGTDTAMLAKELVKTVLDSLHLKTISIAGLSMGAAVVQDFVIAYPNRINKVVLLSAGINGYEKDHPVDSATAAWYPKFSAALSNRDTAKAALEFAKTWGEGIDQKGDSLTKPASRFVYQTTLATLRKHQLKGWPNLQDSPTAYDEIKTIKKPLLIIHGDKDLPFINETSMFLEKAIPGAKRLLLKGAAHMLNMEQPADVNRAILNFLEAK